MSLINPFVDHHLIFCHTFFFFFFFFFCHFSVDDADLQVGLPSSNIHSNISNSLESLANGPGPSPRKPMEDSTSHAPGRVGSWVTSFHNMMSDPKGVEVFTVGWFPLLSIFLCGACIFGGVVRQML